MNMSGMEQQTYSKTDSGQDRIPLHAKRCRLAQCSRNKDQCDYRMYWQVGQWHWDTHLSMVAWRTSFNAWKRSIRYKSWKYQPCHV